MDDFTVETAPGSWQVISQALHAWVTVTQLRCKGLARTFCFRLVMRGSKPVKLNSAQNGKPCKGQHTEGVPGNEAPWFFTFQWPRAALHTGAGVPVGNISFMYATASKSSLSNASCCALGLIKRTPLDAAEASGAATDGPAPSVPIVLAM